MSRADFDLKGRVIAATTDWIEERAGSFGQRASPRRRRPVI
jgi:hypothetical protein